MFHEGQLSHVLRRLVALRKRVGIHCRSKLTILAASHDVYAAEIDDKLIMKIGPGDFAPPDLNNFQIVECGHAWAIWERKDGENAAPAS